MIHGLKPYPEYKDSGVPWLGRVPSAWTVAALRQRYSQCLGKMLDAKRIIGNHLLPYLRNVDVQWDRINTAGLPRMDITLQEYERYTLKPGDLLVCEGGEVGRAAIWSGDLPLCGFQKALHRLRPISRGEVPRYLYYLLQVASRIGAFDDGHTSTIPHLTGDKLRAHRFPFPSGEEQAAIVRFLDHADRRIRRYIGAKKKLIALLNEQKQAIIHRAVTRGLDPGVRLKPSGVEWLGEVPAHWDVRPLKHLVPQVTVGIVVQPAQLYMNSGVPCLRSLNISGGSINTGELVFISAAANERHRKSKISKGDLVVVRTGRAGVAAIVTPEFDGANCIDLLIVRQSTSMLSEYLLVYLNSWPSRTDVQYRSVGAIQAHYNTATLANLVVAAPPIAEQREILEYLADNLKPIESSASVTQNEIDLLHEYRTRLIADVVTGKLDVREAAARLPEEVEESEPLDEGEDQLEEGDGEGTSFADDEAD